MADQIGIGVVGLRNIGMSHVRNIVATPGARLAAVADMDPARLATTTALSEDVHAHTDAAALFADPSVQGVVLALPNHLHAPMAIAAMQAGKHVLVEKPMAMTVAEGEAMIAARDATGTVLMVGMNQRFATRNRAAKGLIDDGAIGDIYAAKTAWLMCRVHAGLWDRGDWFLRRETSGGGPVFDLGIHRLDLALHFMGFPEATTVSAVNWGVVGPAEGLRRGKVYDIEDGGTALIRFAGGQSLTLEASYFWNGVSDGQRTELAGSSGGALIADTCQFLAWTAEGPQPIDLPTAPPGADSCVGHFTRVLRGDEPLGPTAEQGLASLRIVDAIYRSADLGHEVGLG